VTPREQRWVCADCHPKLASPLRNDVEAESTEEPTTDATGEDPEKVIVTDGGRFACPSCGGETINGQGMFGCLSCSWSGVN
jgi:ribosomal protein L37AE/L43A